MLTLDEIEKAIDQLSPGEYHKLMDWLDARPQPVDLQIEAALDAGHMDDIIRRAKGEYEAGLTTPI